MKIASTLVDRVYVVTFRDAPEWFLKSIDSEVIKVGQAADAQKALEEGMYFEIKIFSSEESLFKSVQQRLAGKEPP